MPELPKAIKILGEFKPKIAEEELTTVHYSFPAPN